MMSKTVGMLSIIGLSLPFLLACDEATMKVQSTSSPSTSKPSAQASQSDTTVEVVDTVGRILELYQSNEVAAELNYTGKWAAITGKIERIEPKGGRIEVNLIGLQDLFAMTSSVCKIPQAQTNVAALLRKDEVITIRGRILGVPGVSNVVVEPCELIYSSPTSSPTSTPYPTSTPFPTPNAGQIATAEKIAEIDAAKLEYLSWPHSPASWKKLTERVAAAHGLKNKKDAEGNITWQDVTGIDLMLVNDGEIRKHMNPSSLGH